MEYACECGCGVMVEKTIAFNDACRMRIKRESVRNTNKSDGEVFGKRTEAVRNTNKVSEKWTQYVRKANTDVLKPDTFADKDEIHLTTEFPLCPLCKKEGVETEEGYWCKGCQKRYD